MRIVHALQGPIRILSGPLKEIKKIVFYRRTFDEYLRLRRQVAFLKARFVGMEEVMRENARLEALLGLKRRLVYSSVTANVIARNPSYWNSSLIIDRGSADGIQQGMPVVNALGVVGKVAEVGPHEAKVLLLLDAQFSVAALAQRTRETGLVSGSLEGECRMTYLRRGARIRVGDRIITSRLSSSFPESLVIGEVVDIKTDLGEKTVEAVVEPAVAFSQLEEVLVILKQPAARAADLSLKNIQ